MIVRIPHLSSIGGERLYDLSDGSLSMDPIGVIEGRREVFSAEMLLCDLSEYGTGMEVRIVITGYDENDIEHPGPEPDTVPAKVI